MAVTTTTTTIAASTSAKRSWADIVKGAETPTTTPELEGPITESEFDVAPDAETRLVIQPAKRGERRCHCWGEILVMLGHYGWIMPSDDIDHPDMGKTAGRVYVHKRDVAKGVTLVQGDVVSFYLYADDQGLGAECCQLEKSTWASTDEDEDVHSSAGAPNFRVDADEFVPGGSLPPCSWNLCASEFVPTSATATPTCFSTEAPEFVPATMSSNAQEFVPATMNFDAKEFVPATDCSTFVAPNLNILAFNPAFLSDDESDDESSTVSDDDFSGNEGDKETNDSDKESSSNESSCNESVRSFQQDRGIEWSSRLDAVVLCAPLKSTGALSDDDSTSIGAESDDSESDDMMRFSALAAQLNFPPGVRPPPGLSLPVFAA